MSASKSFADDVVWRLAQLASLPYQERYIIGGDSQEYLLARDVLLDVDVLAFRIDRPENLDLLSDLQRSALKDVLALIEQHGEYVLAGETSEQHFAVIRDSQTWKQLRLKAAEALRQFNVEIERMSVEDIDKLSC